MRWRTHLFWPKCGHPCAQKSKQHNTCISPGKSEIIFLSQNQETLLTQTAIGLSSSLVWIWKFLKLYYLTNCVRPSNAKACWLITKWIPLASFFRRPTSWHFTDISWSTAFDIQGETHLVWLDISKTFGRVWHEYLLSKLSSFGLYPSLSSRMSCFLSKRTTSIRVHWGLPQMFSVNTGVSHSPMFAFTPLLLLSNDLTPTSSPLYCFPDGDNIHCSLSYTSARQATANVCHDRVVLSASPVSELAWMHTWGSTNPSKTSPFCFTQTSPLFSPTPLLIQLNQFH